MDAETIRKSIKMDIDTRDYIVPMEVMQELVNAANTESPMRVYNVLRPILEGATEYVAREQARVRALGNRLEGAACQSK